MIIKKEVAAAASFFVVNYKTLKYIILSTGI